VTATAAAISQNNIALAPQANSGFPLTPNGNNVVVSWDSGINKIFKL
jgi:hypothetical protein